MFLGVCVLMLYALSSRGYQDHMETSDHRALRESRSASFEQLSITSSCTSAVTYTCAFMIILKKRLWLYHPCLNYTAQMPLCVVIEPCVNIWQRANIFPIITVIHRHTDEPLVKNIKLQYLLMARILLLNTD